MHKDLIARFDRRVPRYTSYPTALQFHAGIGPADYARALGALDGRESTSLYLHVPFCDRLCWYCGCHTKIVARYTPVAAFATALAAEIDTVASRIPARLPARQIHWGGGTPTLLAADDFRRLMDRLRARFDVAANAEVAVEIDPRTLKPETVAGLADAGVTRASLGVQDFDPTVQEAVNRVQPLEMVREAVEALRGAGIGALNFDLMYGLPHQDEAGIRRNVELSLSLDPDRIALFGYAHVPWMKKHQRLMPEAALPDAEARWRQMEIAAEALEARGYVWIGLDHFAKPDDPLALAFKARTLRRNFQGYTADPCDVLLGFGPSGIGELPKLHVQNLTEIRPWTAAVMEGRLPTARGVAMTEDDKVRKAAIHGLMCRLDIDLGEVALAEGRPEGFFDADLPRLAPFVADGLVELSGRRLKLTRTGRPLMRTVAATFDAHLKTAEGRHAKAI